MSMKISGENYSIEWSEDDCEWVGHVNLHTKKENSFSYPTVRVRSSFDLDEVMQWVINYLDDMVEHFKEVNKDE